MFYMSEEEYNSKLEKIKTKNESKRRAYLLKVEKKKFKKATKPKMKTSNKVLIASILAVILFTVACMYIQYATSIEISSTLTTLWYGFWTVEIVSLAGIKVSKVVKNYKSPSEEVESEVSFEDDSDCANDGDIVC